MRKPLFLLSLVLTIGFTGCATTKLPSEKGDQRSAVAHLKEAFKKTLSTEERAALYLESAREASVLMSTPASADAARQIYNKAAGNLVILLRDADAGRLWNRTQTLATGGRSYRLRFAGERRDGVWDPAYFTSFVDASSVPLKTIKRRDVQSGMGGALVGVHKTDPLAPFSPRVGITAPVTALLDFKGGEVTLTLVDPTRKPKFPVSGAERVLNADFSAPLAYYPQKSETWEGLMGALHVSKYMGTTGLYMVEPYDPDRIPLIFVHGLISTPRMWRNVINELEMDPTLRGKYQCWVFGYPTGNPPAYSALRFREELARVRQLYPKTRNYVLVGHSMGGLVSRMQVTTVTRKSWEILGKNEASQFFAKVKRGSLIDRATTYQANPHVDRVIFICTPHRGSEMALSGIGSLATKLIALPVDLTAAFTSSVRSSIGAFSGTTGRMPNSVTGLSPKNPTLKVLDSTPIQAAYHTILGDQGKNNTPNSSDGVVPYWSSHLKGEKSERIVPGPHGACELPETLDELRRILHLHLKEH